MLKVVNYKVLFAAQGVELTDSEVQETKKSISRALQVALEAVNKWAISSIVKSKRIIGNSAVSKVTGTKRIPHMATLGTKSLAELKVLTISQVQQWSASTISFTLNDGQSCTIGKSLEYNRSHVFDPAKKITRIEVIISKYEADIFQINFFHHQQRLVIVGFEDNMLDKFGGRKEVFDIADNEQLLGCELDYCTQYFRGVTWLKIKVN